MDAKTDQSVVPPSTGIGVKSTAWNAAKSLSARWRNSLLGGSVCVASACALVLLFRNDGRYGGVHRRKSVSDAWLSRRPLASLLGARRLLAGPEMTTQPSCK
ncbi:hypothetical protein GGI26_004810 [Coemansia sp. RSA 1358]|nr:hypothetical protein GGI26_004810 [Coemansia sp. RSA 1358]